jgi:hypothetical protein
MKPEPAAAITAASAAADAMGTLAAAGIPPDLPLAGHARLLSLLHDSARLLADALQTEARLTGHALMLPLGTISEILLIDDAARARGALTRAAHFTDAAADHLRQAWREAAAPAVAEDGPGAGPSGDALVIRRAREASHRAADLADALTAAEHHADGGIPALALITGHRQVAEALYAGVAQLAGTCAELREPLTDTISQLAPDGRARPGRAAGPLGDAAAQLRQAGRRVFDVQETLTGTLALHRLAAGAGAAP